MIINASALKRKDILTHATMEMNLEATVLGDICHLQKKQSMILPRHIMSWSSQIQRQKE